EEGIRERNVTGVQTCTLPISITPSEVETDVNGQARAAFSAGGMNGTAIISASSGGASATGNTAVRIAVGTAGVGKVILNANPTVISALSGTSVITAAISDINGNPLSSAQVAFSTTAGSLDATLVTTDTNGIA